MPPTDGSAAGVLRNWAGNVTFTPDTLHRPRSVDELRALVAHSPRVRALGTGHSFSTVADGPGALVTVADLPLVADIDASTSTVRVSAGVRWGELAPIVHDAGFALRSMGSLPHISVAGSVATGTHGSGNANGCLAASVAALEVVTADGALRTVRRGESGFDGWVVSLGALGVVSAVTLDLVPAYDMTQTVHDGLPWSAGLEHLREIMGSAYSVSLFTRWRGEGFEQVWVKHRVGDEQGVPIRSFGARVADGPRHPVPGASAVHCTEQGGVPGPWFERLPHFRLGFTPSSGDELQTEYLVGLADAGAALEAVDRLRDLVAPVLQIGEIRTVAADDLWLSPCTGRDTLAIHFTWIADPTAVLPVVREIETALAPFDARPHWGKVFDRDPEVVAALYPRMREFRDLVDQVDPERTFGSEFLDRYVHGVG